MKYTLHDFCFVSLFISFFWINFWSIFLIYLNCVYMCFVQPLSISTFHYSYGTVTLTWKSCHNYVFRLVESLECFQVFFQTFLWQNRLFSHLSRLWNSRPFFKDKDLHKDLHERELTQCPISKEPWCLNISISHFYRKCLCWCVSIFEEMIL